MDVVERFLTWHRGLNHSEHTISSYGATVRALARQLPGFVTAERAPVREAVQALLSGAPSSRNQRLAAVKSFYGWLIEEAGLREDNPVASMRAASLSQLLPKALPDDLAARLLVAPDDGPEARRDTAVIATLLSTGLRLAELCSLDVADVAGTRVRVLGKGQKERIVFLNERARRALECWLAVRHRYRPTGEALFLNRLGGRIGPDGVERLVAGRCPRGVHVTPHQLRHTLATRLARGKVPLEEIRRLLGHTSGVTTQRYIDLAAGDLERSYMEAMGD